MIKKRRVIIDKNKFAFLILYFMLLLMPFHYYICELFISQTSIDNLFRDILTIILFVIVVRKIKLDKVGVAVLVNCIVLIFYAMFSLKRGNLAGKLNILRIYIVPSLIFFVCRDIKMTLKRINSLYKMMIIVFAADAVYGFFQAMFLGPEFLIKLGYKLSGSIYISGFWGMQRSLGTYNTANFAGTFFGCGFLILLLYKEVNIKYRSVLIPVYIIGIIATFSRSSVLGLVFALLLIGFMQPGAKKKIFIFKLIAGFAIGILALYGVDAICLSGRIFTMLSSYIVSSFSMKDTSVIGHIDSLLSGLNLLFENPFGRGFGDNGPRALEFSSRAALVESSIILMMYEIGILFGILYFMPYTFTIIDSIKNRKRYLNYVPLGISVLFMTGYLLLPNVQNFEFVFMSHMFMGFYYNPSIKTIYSVHVPRNTYV